MIEGINEEERLHALNSLHRNSGLTAKVFKSIQDGETTTIGADEVANLMVQSVLNQTAIMDALRALLIKEGEVLVDKLEGESNGDV